MAISLLQSTSGTTAFGTVATATYGSNLTQGSLLLVYVGWNSTDAVSSMVDSDGNVYKQIFNNTWSAQVSAGYLWAAVAARGGVAPVITVTKAGGSNRMHALAREYSGVSLAGIDTTANTTNSGVTTHTSSTSSPTSVAQELVIGLLNMASGTATISAGATYGNLQAGNTQVAGKIYWEDKLVTTVGAQTATFGAGTSSNSQCAVVTFAAAGLAINNFQFAKAGDGMSTSEKIR